MFYRVFRALLTLCLNIFYRRIEAPGLEAIPQDGPLLLVANHGSALMDPLLLLVLVPRRPGAWRGALPLSGGDQS